VGTISLSRRDELEKSALQFILEKGDEGILQRDLWKMLNASSREGSRISLKLETRNLIKREKELSDGRWTYRIFIKKRPLDIDYLLDIPCMTCNIIDRCEMGGKVSSINCVGFSQWLFSLGEA
jgi:hypothetical protein